MCADDWHHVLKHGCWVCLLFWTGASALVWLKINPDGTYDCSAKKFFTDEESPSSVGATEHVPLLAGLREVG